MLLCKGALCGIFNMLLYVTLDISLPEPSLKSKSLLIKTNIKERACKTIWFYLENKIVTSNKCYWRKTKILQITVLRKKKSINKLSWMKKVPVLYIWSWQCYFFEIKMTSDGKRTNYIVDKDVHLWLLI